MKIKDGTITVGSSPAAVTYTRDIANYMLPKAASSDASAATTAKNNARKASILVLPESTADKSTVEATLTIDNQDYKVALPGSNSAWEAGENYLYTVKLSGSELVISSVTVTQWSNGCFKHRSGYKVIEEKLNKIIDEERIHSFAPWDRIPVLHSLFR